MCQLTSALSSVKSNLRKQVLDPLDLEWYQALQTEGKGFLMTHPQCVSNFGGVLPHRFYDDVIGLMRLVIGFRQGQACPFIRSPAIETDDVRFNVHMHPWLRAQGFKHNNHNGNKIASFVWVIGQKM